MRNPDPFSALALKPITEEMAHAILDDSAFIQECVLGGIEFEKLIEGLRRPIDARLRIAAEASTQMLEMLAAANARFVLIGGLAGCAYGAARFATKDLDICHARDRENLEIFVDVLERLRAKFRRLPRFAPERICADTFLTETDFIFTGSHGDIDLIGEFTGVGRYEQASSDSVTMRLGGYEIQVLSLPKLTAAKLSTGRPKDLKVYHELQTIQRALGIAYGPPIPSLSWRGR